MEIAPAELLNQRIVEMRLRVKELEVTIAAEKLKLSELEAEQRQYQQAGSSGVSEMDDTALKKHLTLKEIH